MTPSYRTLDANEAAASVAYRASEVIAIYPITPASAMGEYSDAWSAEGRRNLWNTVPRVVEMQSEGGAAGAVHGALQTGTLATTFTASQGLLLMIPNMYKIAGELTPAVIHVAARSLAAQALSIFGDHSDVMAVRATGFAMLCSASVQEAQDFAAIAHAVTLESRVPFVHFFDGFRTSHELNKIAVLGDDALRQLLPEDAVAAHRARALSPDRPVIRGTAQNPDVFFQAREATNPYHVACAGLVQRTMDRFAELTGRRYRLFEYHGAPDAERVIVLMGSGCEAVHETVDALVAGGEKVGVLKVRLFRPFDAAAFASAIPRTARAVAVLDRTKEPGSVGEPLYLDCVTAIVEQWGNGGAAPPHVVGGRYGLSSKEFTPALVRAVFQNLEEGERRNHFTVGIVDDVTGTSLEVADPAWSVEPDDVVRAVFYGLGSDGTVGANKNSIQIIGEETDCFAQGYFVYDSKKSGAVTVSHLRFGPRPIRSTYLIGEPTFVACHHEQFLEQVEMLATVCRGSTFLLNSRHGPSEIWDRLPREVQAAIVEKELKLFVIDAYRVAHESGMSGRINTTMQVAFFALSGVLPRDEAIAAIKRSIGKSYARKGAEIVRMNHAAVDAALAHLHEVEVPLRVTATRGRPPVVSPAAPDFVQRVTAPILAGRGDALPVSAMPVDGTYPVGTAKWEKRNLAEEIPVWDTGLCIQCGKCAMVCPHAVIRIKAFEPERLAGAPATFKSCDARERDWKGLEYSIQVSPEDCTGCGICIDVCPAKSKSEARLKALRMEPQAPLREPESENWEFFLSLPEMDRTRIKTTSIKQQQVQQPLFEFSGACAGCGETPYLKLVSQLFGDRALVANATGCSSIYGGNLPTTPWSADASGRGPAWANSLFEDNAEFGLGFRVSLDKQREFALELARSLAGELGAGLVEAIAAADQSDEAGIRDQRERVVELERALAKLDTPAARQLRSLTGLLVRKSVWIVGGDGWAYDIGYGGLDHVLASGLDVNVLVLDTEVYSNTGGQMSKATPRGAVAKFAMAGKPTMKKDLGMLAMGYGNVYVARVAMGAKDEHTLKAFLEAEAYPGPSLIIAYSHCIAHGIPMDTAMTHQKALVDSGRWLLYRYHPDRAARGESPLCLDSKRPSVPVAQSMYLENRFRMLSRSHPEAARQFLEAAQRDAETTWTLHENLSKLPPPAPARSTGEEGAG